MGCCEDLDIPEKRMYQVVAKVKNQHRTGNFRDAIECYDCTGIVTHEFVKKQFLGFIVRIKCPQCNWEFEG